MICEENEWNQKLMFILFLLVCVAVIAMVGIALGIATGRLRLY